MKICLLGDTHFGIRNDSKVFHEYYEKFYDDIFFPYLKEHGIDTVIQLGDLFDRRKYINFVSLSESRRYFFDKLKENGIHLHALVGNHDIFYKHTLEVNSPELLLRDYDNITLWSKPGTLEIDGVVFDMIPWICNENERDVREFISKSTSPYCIGHFELVGYYMQRGQISHEGYDDKFLKNYDQVYSGHYHSRSASVDGKIIYLGTPYELFWSDYQDPKGFGVFDTQLERFDFVRNPHRIFHKLIYDDTGIDEHKFITELNFERFRDKYVKVVVVNKTNPYLFDKTIDEIYKAQPTDISIVEDFTDITEGVIEDDVVDQAQDTMTILSNYIDGQTLSIESTKLKTLMRELYVEALSTENIE
jgi:DNA repair exonuclease SbcCD nuclease subunit